MREANRKRIIFARISLVVFLLGFFSLVMTTIIQVSSNKEELYPLRIQRRLEALEQGGKYSYETSGPLPVNSKLKEQAQANLKRILEEDENNK